MPGSCPPRSRCRTPVWVSILLVNEETSANKNGDTHEEGDVVQGDAVGRGDHGVAPEEEALLELGLLGALEFFEVLLRTRLSFAPKASQ